MAEALPLEGVVDARRARTLLHPLRLKLLGLLREPASAAEAALRLGLSRQRGNYHVRALARAGFLHKAGRQRKRNMVEQRYVATARGYVLAPEVLGPVGASAGASEDALSASYLLALTARAQSELLRSVRAAGAGGKRLATLGLEAALRFESAEQRAAFTRALEKALVDVISRHTAPDVLESGAPGAGRRYRLMLGCYPVPDEPDAGPAAG
jgi:hypothetical protein